MFGGGPVNKGIRRPKLLHEDYDMRRGLNVGLLLILLLSCVGCDQATKTIARNLLASSDQISLLNDLIILEYAENPGGFLSIGAELPSGTRFLIFAVFAGAAMTILLVLTIRNRNISLTQLIGMALVTSGGIGNLIDRIINDGLVVDFVSLGIGALRTGIFNVADLEIIVGAAILIAGLIKIKEGTKRDA